MKNLNKLGFAAIMVAGLGIGFIGGAEYFKLSAQNKLSDKDLSMSKLNNNNLNTPIADCSAKNQEGLVFKGVGALAGSVMSMGENSFTLKIPDGSSKLVFYTDKTFYSKTQKASKDLLQSGAEVAVYGVANSDGSVTANNIQLNPMFFGTLASPLPTAK